MARVRSTARVYREGEETEVAETTPISKVMKQSGLVVTEWTVEEGAPAAEAEHTITEEEDIDEEEDYSILIPSKPFHLDFEKSTVSEADVPMMMKLGYFREAERKLVWFVEAFGINRQKRRTWENPFSILPLWGLILSPPQHEWRVIPIESKGKG
jgi:hypothetical protein